MYRRLSASQNPPPLIPRHQCTALIVFIAGDLGARSSLPRVSRWLDLHVIIVSDAFVTRTSRIDELVVRVHSLLPGFHTADVVAD